MPRWLSGGGRAYASERPGSRHLARSPGTYHRPIVELVAAVIASVLLVISSMMSGNCAVAAAPDGAALGCGPQSSLWLAESDPEWRTWVPDAAMPANFSPPAVERMGTIDAEAGAAHGAGTYEVSLFVPPGRSGMAPVLALQYSSLGSSELAGVGWTVTGASRIHRCPRTQEHDAQVAPVGFTPQDRLCLDGQRLVAVAGTYGIVNTEYRTELDTFARITQLGNLEEARSCFRMEEKSGRIVTFGGCNDRGAAEIPPGQIRPYAWAQERVSDRLGNEMKYEYVVEDGQHLLRKVHYTGFAGALGSRRVELSYEARPDVQVAYHAQGQMRSVRRLQAITSFAATAVARRYQLEYLVSPATGRSLLQALRMCAAVQCDDSNSLPKTVFGYQTQSPSFVREQIPTADPLREHLYLVSDYDGDGSRDVVRETWRYRSGGTLTSRFLELSAGTRIDLTGGGAGIQFDSARLGSGIHFGVDFDRDGRTDLWGVRAGVFAISTWHPSRQSFEIKTSNLALPASLRDLHLADFNADGRMDVMVIDGSPGQPSQLTVHAQCPTSPSGQIAFCGRQVLGTAVSECERALQVADFDGNGYPDLLFDDDRDHPGVIYANHCPGPPHLVFLRTQGADLATADTTLAQMGGPSFDIAGNPDGAMHILDVNGDGLLDFVHLPTSHPAIAWINEGGNQVGLATKLRREVIAGVGPGAALASLVRLPDLNNTVKTGDVDGDGRAELLVPAERTGAWCQEIYNAGTGEWIERCSYGASPLALPPGLDRALYRWDLVDLDIDTAGHVNAVQRRTDLEAPIRRSRKLEDHFGDGLADVMFELRPAFSPVSSPCTPTATNDCTWVSGDYASGFAGLSHGTWLARHRGPVSDLLTSIVDGVGARTRFHYAPLSSTGHAECASPVGQPFYRANHGAFTRDDKHSLFTSSMQVLSRIERENGTGGLNGTCYRYANAWTHQQGRGFVGFGEITEEDDVPGDSANDLRRIRRYLRDFPFIGRIEIEAEMLATDPLEAQPITRTHNSWQSSCRTATGQLTRICFPYLYEQRDERRDLATRALLGTTTTTHAYWPGDVRHGNVSLTIIETSDVHHTQQSRIAYTYDYADAVNWWVDKLVSKTESFDPMVAAAAPAAPGRPVTAVTSYEYGAGRLRKWVRVQPGVRDQSLATFTDHDRYGNPTLVRQEAAGASIRRTTTTYTADGYFPEVTRNPLGHATTQLVDPVHGKTTRVTDPSGNVTVMLYDAFARRIGTDTADRPPVFERLLGCPAGSCPSGAVLREVTMQAGAPTRTQYLDALGRPVRRDTAGFAGAVELSMVHVRYDARGRKVGESEPTFDPDPARAYFTTWERHDALGRPGRKTVARSGWRSPSVFAYTYVGHDTRITLPGVTNPIVRIHDSLGRLVRVVDPYGKPTDYRYEPRGNLALIQDALGNRTMLVYDERGRKVSVDHPDQGLAITRYDGFGQPIATTDARKITVERVYDLLGRPVARSVGGTLEAQWGYDRTRPGTLDYERGGTAGLSNYCRGFEYDSFGKVIRSVAFMDGLTFSTGTAYDAVHGRPKAVRYPSGRVVALDYTDQGYLARERNAAPSLAGWSRRVTGLAANGRIRAETFGNGLAGTYQHDAASGQTTSLWVAKPGRPLVTIQSLTYEYDDPQGGLSRQRNGVTGLAETFTYDAVSRLDEAIRTWPDGASETVDYQYDVIGNLVVKGDYSAQTSYGDSDHANPANAGPHAIRSYRKLNGLTISDFRYDSSGNLVAGDGRTTKYDAYNKPVDVSEGGSAVRYAYGPGHERYKRVAAGVTTYYLDKLHERIMSGTSVLQRDYVGDKILITRLPGGVDHVRYLHPDRLGSVDTITDAAGAVVARHGFEPFGGPRDGQWHATPELGNPVTDRGFTGHEHVDAVHLIHTGGRAYDYRLGRFLSVDPFVAETGDMQSLNAYSYVRNNPTGRIDPTGYLDRWDWVKRAEGFIITVLSASSARSAAGDSGKGDVGTPASEASAMRGEQPAKAPEDTGAPGKQSLWDRVKAKGFAWVKLEDVKLKGNGEEGALQLGSDPKGEHSYSVEGEQGAKLTVGPAAIGMKAGKSELTVEAEISQKLGGSIEVKAAGGATLDAKEGGDKEATLGRLTTFIKGKLSLGKVYGIEGEAKVETSSHDLGVQPSVRYQPDRQRRQALFDQVQGLREGAPQMGEYWREVHGR
jgi:RHS repeat-associated protein